MWSNLDMDKKPLYSISFYTLKDIALIQFNRNPNRIYENPFSPVNF